MASAVYVVVVVGHTEIVVFVPIGVVPCNHWKVTAEGPFGLNLHASLAAVKLVESLPGAANDGGLVPPPLIPIVPLPPCHPLQGVLFWT